MSRAASSLLDEFPPAVLATAFATFVAFLGIGVVDPVLPTIAEQLGASHATVEFLFTSYILVMSVTMLVSGSLSTRLGGKRTMLLGLGVVAVFAGLCGLAPNVPVLAALRGGWGFGNALFTTTALSIIVGVSAGETAAAITLYEAALGLGIAAGPLLGGFLGANSWRYPFFATATLMAFGFVVTAATVAEPEMAESRQSVSDVLGALGDAGVRANALVGLVYSFGFFVVLAYSPLVLGLSAVDLGLTFFAWGALVAFSSVLVANRLVDRFGAVTTVAFDLTAFVAILGLMGVVDGRGLVALVVLSGFVCGIANATLTTLAMDVSPYTRSVSSAAYNSLRWAGAAVAPVLAGFVGPRFGAGTPFLLAGGLVVVSVVGLVVRGDVVRAGVAAAGGESAD